MLKPLPARLLRYALYLCASLLICVTILLWQAPNLIQRHLPGWLATHYGLQLTLGKIEVGLRSPSVTLGPSALLDEQQHPLVSFDGLRLIPKLKESWRQRALVLEELTLTAPRVDLVRLADNKGEASFNLTEVLAPLLDSLQTRESTASSTEPVVVSIGKLALVQGQFHYRDSRKQHSPGWVPPLTLGKIALQLPDFSSTPSALNPYRLSATLNEKSPLKADGEFNIMTGAGKGQLSLGKLALAPLAPLWAPYVKATLAKGEASYSTVCVACHAADGNSSIAENPKLAQQHPEYLVKQLQEFKSGKRANAIMSDVAQRMSDEDMKAVANFIQGLH